MMGMSLSIFVTFFQSWLFCLLVRSERGEQGKRETSYAKSLFKIFLPICLKLCKLSDAKKLPKRHKPRNV